MLDRISFFPANQISPDSLLTWPLQDIFPYHTHYFVHTIRSTHQVHTEDPDEADSGGNK